MGMATKRATGLEPDPRPDLVVERGPQNSGVGRWVPEQKHMYLTKYVDGTREAAKKWGQRILIDPFCGPGRIQVEGESLTRDGGAVIAWRQSQYSGAPYTRMLIGDLVAERALACEARLSALGAPAKAFTGPAEETVHRMIEHVPRTALCTIYLDPYNLELLSFDIIKALSALKAVDFAVHFSTMDLVRNIEFEFDPQRARFDGTAPHWRERMDFQGNSKSRGPGLFFEYWVALVKALGFTVSHSMPLITNNTNHGIYRLVFFSRHELPNKIWGEVARGPNRELF
jgi:three-Cys-motif partner protein